jgi:hypothetical protein
VWSPLTRAIANFVATELKKLVHFVKRKLKKIQLRPHPDRWLPHRDRPDRRTLMTTQPDSTSSTGVPSPARALPPPVSAAPLRCLYMCSEAPNSE